VIESLALRLLMLLAAAPLVVVAHELGHVIGGRLGGYYVAAAGIGGGRRFLTIPLSRRFNLFVGPLPLAGGATIAFPTRVPMGRANAFVYHYGGIAIQLLLQLALHLLYWRLPDLRTFLLPAVALNGAVIVANLVPYRIRVGGILVASDGARALAAIAAGRGDAPQPEGGMGTEGFDAVAARIGTPVGHHVLSLCRAQAGENLPPGTSAPGPPPPATPAFYASLPPPG
jgi:hypothetical protein